MSSSRVTELLQRLRRGDAGAGDDLLPLVHAELRRLAGQLMAGERREHTLQPTALVHEAWLRLHAGRDGDPADRAEFLRVAARAMRRVLVDHARERGAGKRGGSLAREAFDHALADPASVLSAGAPADDVLSVHEALGALEATDPELARVVELRYFAGLDWAETARAMDATVGKARWSWSLARGWLRRHLDDGERRG